MRVVTFNIRYGKGTDGVYDLSRTIDAITGYDLIALQEVDRHWDRSNNDDQVALLAQAFPNYYLAWVPSVDILKSPDAQDLIDNRRQFGNLLLSRFPILTIRHHSFQSYRAAKQLSIHRGMIEAVVDMAGRTIRVYVVHLSYPLPGCKQGHVSRFLEIFRGAEREGPPIAGEHSDTSWTAEPCPSYVPNSSIVLGDFNLDPSSEDYSLIVGDRHSRHGRMTPFVGGLMDAWTLVHGGNETAATQSSDGVTFLGRRIDYCFVSPDMADKVKSAEVLAETIASDHLPVAFRFEF
ncbi:hypothetical protein ILFOPFJJ_01805 [Ensifer psoraleae]|uniref:endonuclease/exonuclease/phosphatase family protein n=1 Tax=Sinorhizobium psoraleae TaxID=520838 RepID=UPI001567CBD2|nr:endonuclease/exonuclease/phosphatase family protein [Sinorhizobium psoraleae]NRP70923.1 hypothetical protein [Sinorhizobium psoraleae]